MQGLSVDCIADLQRAVAQQRGAAKAVAQARVLALRDRERAALRRLSYPAEGWRVWAVQSDEEGPLLTGPFLDAEWQPGEVSEDVYATATSEWLRRYFAKELLPHAQPALFLMGRVLMWGERRVLRDGDSDEEARFQFGYPIELCGAEDRREPRARAVPVATIRQQLRQRYGLPDMAHTLYERTEHLHATRPKGSYHRTVDLSLIAERVESMNPRVLTSGVHGWRHANRVAEWAVRLAAKTPDADVMVAFLFGVLHDTLRHNDENDPEHGVRAASLGAELNGDAYQLDAAQLAKLVEAIRDHDRGQTSVDPTVGACWDADRLQLSRVGITPNPRLLSTEAARGATLRVGSVDHHRTPGLGVALSPFVVVPGLDTETFTPWDELVAEVTDGRNGMH